SSVCFLSTLNHLVQGNPDHLDLKPRIRGSPHILLIGDPGTAKSVLLRVATDISHRAVLTAATGTTAAGLTATAVRDANGWCLDAGALVLADGGLCAIDEFTALHGAHRSAVHEAMEQQTISLAKAGLVTRLNCRCSVLAAANPPPCTGSRTDEFGLPTPLLSRFDIIWRLMDPLNSAYWDRKIANFVLKLDRTK
ncbi:DNA helicase MCM9, partial [Paragonimus westermani]